MERLYEQVQQRHCKICVAQNVAKDRTLVIVDNFRKLSSGWMQRMVKPNPVIWSFSCLHQMQPHTFNIFLQQ